MYWVQAENEDFINDWVVSTEAFQKTNLRCDNVSNAIYSIRLCHLLESLWNEDTDPPMTFCLNCLSD